MITHKEIFLKVMKKYENPNLEIIGNAILQLIKDKIEIKRLRNLQSNGDYLYDDISFWFNVFIRCFK